MDILFLGSVVREENVKKLSGASFAGNNMQLNILRELNKYYDINIHAFTILPLATFPKEKKLYVKQNKELISDNLYVHQVPYINIPFLKQLSQIFNLYRYAKKNIKEESMLLSFNLYPQEGCPLVKLKKKYNLKAAVILADLPIDDDYNAKGIRKKIRAAFFDIAKRNIREVDNYVVLNENAIFQFAPKANYIVMEGGIDETTCETCVESCIPYKNIVYTGALTDYSGIRELITAMGFVQDDIILEIYGDGNSREYVQNFAQNQKNIIYKGNVTNKEIRSIQKKAWLLINPRPVDDPIAKVTFPSKIFEYMLSGRPILSTKQTGFTEEYLQHMYIAKSNSPEDLAKCIRNVASLSDLELSNKGRCAYEFISQQKTWKKQVEKIYYFLKERHRCDI